MISADELDLNKWAELLSELNEHLPAEIFSISSRDFIYGPLTSMESVISCVLHTFHPWYLYLSAVFWFRRNVLQAFTCVGILQMEKVFRDFHLCETVWAKHCWYSLTSVWLGQPRWVFSFSPRDFSITFYESFNELIFINSHLWYVDISDWLIQSST